MGFFGFLREKTPKKLLNFIYTSTSGVLEDLGVYRSQLE